MAKRSTAAAKKTEADKPVDELITVEFRGEKFTCPKSRAKWPTRAHQAFQRRNNADGIELLLGPEQWDRLNTVAPAMEDFWEFFGAFTAVANAGLVPDKSDKPDEDSDDSADDSTDEG